MQVLLLALAHATLAASSAAACECAGFCSGQCSLPMNSTPSSTIDLYRLTPNNITDLVNKDTGDAMGDVFFVINEYDLPHRCLNGSSSNARGCFLDVDDVIMHFEVEVAGEYGPYLHCNPPSNGKGGNLPGTFSCAPMSHDIGYNNSFYCDCARTNTTVGSQRVSMQFGSFGGFVAALSRKLDGVWYSTTQQGRCNDNDPVGTDGCSWKPQSVVKVANASCVQSRLYRHVESRNATCFQACPGARPPPALPDRSTECVIQCFQSTVLGMTADQLVAPWTNAFASGNERRGGCPACTANSAGVYECPVW